MENVVVIGGGIAGLTAAKTLAESGLSPIVLEKSKEFGQKPCGELIVEKFYGFSIHDFIDDDSSIERRFDHLTVNYCGKDYVFNKSYIMLDRKQFEESTARSAMNAGAEIRMGTEVHDIKRCNSSILINNELEAKLVIGADGFNSIVRKSAGMRDMASAFAITAEAKTDFSHPFLFIDPEAIIPCGYAWIFPKKEGSNVGIGCFRGINVPPYWKRFSERMGIEALHLKGAPIPISLPSRTYFDNIMLVGDAARLANSSTGGGIASALISGLLSAKVAKDALENNRTEENFLRKYEEEWKKLIYKYLFRCYLKKKLFWEFFVNHKLLGRKILRSLF